MKKLLLILSISISSCSILEPLPMPDVNAYTLAPHHASMKVKPKRKGSILVNRMRVNRIFAQSYMMYKPSAFEYDAFVESRWITKPSNMIMASLTDAIRQADAFQSVYESRPLAPADWHLMTELLEIYQDFTVKPSRAVVKIQASIKHKDAHKPLVSKTIIKAVNATQDNAKTGVLAMNKAVAAAIQDIIRLTLDYTSP